MKRGGEVVVLALLLTLLCLALGGAGCKQPEPQRCKYVVGDQTSDVSVQYCKMSDGSCYYVSGDGALLPTECYDSHPFAQEVKS